MKQKFLILATAVVALVGGIVAKQFVTPAAQPVERRLNFSLPDLSGEKHSIDEWRDKLLIINFWATWCPPCLKEIPEFIKLQDELAADHIQFIGIAIEEREPVTEFLNTHPVNYPMLIAGDAGIELSRQLGNLVGAVPFTIFVNRQGQVIYRHPGALSREKLLEIVRPLL